GLVVQYGNVGIGTTGPGSDVAWAIPALDISGSRGTAIIRTTGAAGVATLRMTGPGASSVDDWHINMYAGANSYLAFYPKAGGEATGLVLKNDGNVGIGTSNVSFPLHIQKNNSGWLTAFQNTNTGGGSVYLANGNGYGAYIGAGTDSTASTYALRVTGSGGTYLNVTGAGNVGIGTTAPGAKLHVSGGDIYMSSNNAKLRVGDGSYTYIADYSSSDTDKLELYGAQGVIFTGSKNVGIGVTAPGAKLEVAGQVKITGGSPGAGKVLTSNAAGLATWQTFPITCPCGTCWATEYYTISSYEAYYRMCTPAGWKQTSPSPGISPP
ncbi:hypothetical protein KKF83_02615, partial [Patescibacteria group bacterium]|nr:hypothetical protein [Patescibacteria group bacterium]